MDPLSIIASIGGICGTTVKLISNVSEFIDSVSQAPKEVQSLSNELASLYAGFGHIRVAIQAPRVSKLPEKWMDNFHELMTDSEATLKEVQALINKAKITETTGSAKLVWKSIKFVFNAKQVEFLKRRILSQNGILSNLLAALAETRGSHIEQRLEDIHNKIGELMSTRANVREVLVVLEKDEEAASDADYTLSDRRKQPTSTRTDNGNNDQTRGISEEQTNIHDPPAGSRDIVSEVRVAVAPSVDTQKALEIIKTRIWELQDLRYRESGQTAWNTEVRKDYRFKNCQRLRCKLFIGENIYIRKDGYLILQFLRDEQDAIVHFSWFLCTAELQNCTVSIRVVSDGDDSQIDDGKYDVDFNFQSTQDAQDFYFCFSHLARMVGLIHNIKLGATSFVKPHVSHLSSGGMGKPGHWDLGMALGGWDAFKRDLLNGRFSGESHDDSSGRNVR